MGKIDAPHLEPLPSAENVSEVVLDEMAVVETQAEPRIPLYVPGIDAPYKYLHNVEDWIYAFGEMCERIGNSTKYSDNEKLEKAKSLARCNEGYMETFSIAQKMIVNSAIAYCGEKK
jgi:hypothetical protein